MRIRSILVGVGLGFLTSLALVFVYDVMRAIRLYKDAEAVQRKPVDRSEDE